MFCRLAFLLYLCGADCFRSLQSWAEGWAADILKKAFLDVNLLATRNFATFNQSQGLGSM